jgi:electron transport complex protein RnfG
MNRTTLTSLRPALACAVVAAASMIFMAFSQPKDEVITKEGKTTIITTTTLAADVEGYAGPTPLKIYIKAGRVEKIEALPNVETPKYFALITRQLLDKWNGLTAKKAATQEVDVVTGATFSSEAVIENVRRGINFYNKKGKK